jgi:16S rRNA (cytidine1402-2'-O)-methyltransferase
LLKTLQDFNQYFGDERKASISRELTKLYEENIQGTFSELIAHFQKSVLKGEFVIVVSGKLSK